MLRNNHLVVWFVAWPGFELDQQNYHIGIPFLIKNGTFWRSIMPAGIQSYFNPYVLQFQFLAMSRFGAIGFAILTSCLQSTAFPFPMLAGLLCVEICRGTQGPARFLLGFLLCLMAPMSLSESGTSFIDLTTAIPVLAAYRLLLARGRWRQPAACGAMAGMLLGAATALKLTNGVFIIGVAGFALAGTDTRRTRLCWLAACGAAAMLSFLAIGGYWHFIVWQRFGNPFFPYFNNIFRSPDFPSVALRDDRFLPRALIDIWRYPFYWLSGRSPSPAIGSPSSEVPFADARWMMAIAGLTLFMATWATRRHWRSARLAEPATGLLFAFSADYLAWLALFGIHRYAIPIDILCGAVILALTMSLSHRRMQLGVLVLAVGITWRTMAVPDWGHVPWRHDWQTINPTPAGLGGPAIIFITGVPMLFVAASLPPDAHYVNITGTVDMQAGNDTVLTAQLKDMLHTESTRRLLELDEGALPAAAGAILASYGLAGTQDCQFLSVASRKFRLCDVRRGVTLPPASQPLPATSAPAPRNRRTAS